jgi:hypothetical protein
MKITLADKLIAWLTLLSGLSISAVAVYYSVAGLISIFAAAVIPIAIMGVTLEVSKLVATIWLKQNWTIAPRFIKSYLLIAVLILMLITSMGIFGYLSKAHSDQSLVSGDVQAKIAVYDEKIKVAKDNIDANRKALKQMDESVDQVMGRSQDEKGADKAVALRRAQAKERTRLLSEITAEQKVIAQLNEERAPIAAEVRKVEAEVGPIKYIASFLYGDDPDTNLLERAVRFVIIVIVIVFDPLAVILLLASQYSFQYFRRVKEEEAAIPAPVEITPPPPPPAYEPDEGALTEDQIKQINDMLAEHAVHLEPEIPEKEKQPVEEDNSLQSRIASGETYISGEGKEVPLEEKNDSALEQWNKMIAEAEKAVQEETQTPKESKFPENPERGDRAVDYIDGVQRNLIFNGEEWINADTSNQEAVKELDESKKKNSYIIKENGQQVTKTKE